MSHIREAIKTLNQEEREQIRQYATSIKEIKNKITELINKGKKNLAEQGGNMSNGLIMHED